MASVYEFQKSTKKDGIGSSIWISKIYQKRRDWFQYIYFKNLRKKTLMASVYEFSKIYKKRRDWLQYIYMSFCSEIWSSAELNNKYVMELILQNSCVYDMYIPYVKNILSLTYFCTCSHRIMYSYSWWKKLAKLFKICHFTYKDTRRKL